MRRAEGTQASVPAERFLSPQSNVWGRHCWSVLPVRSGRDPVRGVERRYVAAADTTTLVLLYSYSFCTLFSLHFLYIFSLCSHTLLILFLYLLTMFSLSSHIFSGTLTGKYFDASKYAKLDEGVRDLAVCRHRIRPVSQVLATDNSYLIDWSIFEI